MDTLNGRNLVVDTFSEVYQELRPWITHEFWDMGEHEPIPNSVYVIGRKQFIDHRDRVRALIDDPRYTVFFDNAAEGSWTLVSQLRMLKLDELAREKKLLIIGGGDMEPDYAYIQWDHFLTGILDYEENLKAMTHIDTVLTRTHKPYDFMFLNGRSRPHRKYLYERFRELGLLDRSLWTMLDSTPCMNRSFRLERDGVNLMLTQTPRRWLDKKYEFEFYRESVLDTQEPSTAFVKHELFHNEWGEIYLEPAGYEDTYFSVVTETVFEYPYSFRTEKIAKPLAMGHPWICAASQHYYRDIRNLGFRTFGSVIDESFDQIENHQDRMDRIVDIVQDLCNQDLVSFQTSCQDICKYNQQHLREIAPRLRADFPSKFFNLIAQHG